MGNGTLAGCPYYWCKARPELLWTGVNPFDNKDETLLIESHTIENDALTGLCPASLMEWPVSDPARAHLDDQKEKDGPKVVAHQGRKAWADRHRGVDRQNESTTLRGPHRAGLEPADDAPDWALGGRDDEDIPEPAQPDTKIPDTTYGQPLGGPVNVQEMVGRVKVAENHGSTASEIANVVGDKLEECQAGIQQGIEELNAGIAALASVMGDEGSSTGRLFTALNALREARNLFEAATPGVTLAITKMEYAKSMINESKDQGNAWISNLYA